jgi:hypothetical protein
MSRIMTNVIIMPTLSRSSTFQKLRMGTIGKPDFTLALKAVKITSMMTIEISIISIPGQIAQI